MALMAMTAKLFAVRVELEDVIESDDEDEPNNDHWTGPDLQVGWWVRTKNTSVHLSKIVAGSFHLQLFQLISLSLSFSFSQSLSHLLIMLTMRATDIATDEVMKERHLTCHFINDLTLTITTITTRRGDGIRISVQET
jgi:hypothetical protein